MAQMDFSFGERSVEHVNIPNLQIMVSLNKIYLGCFGFNLKLTWKKSNEVCFQPCEDDDASQV